MQLFFVSLFWLLLHFILLFPAISNIYFTFAVVLQTFAIQANKQSSMTTTKMKSDNEQDLTTILSSSQRSELTLLLASIIEFMRRSLLDNFDAKAGPDQSLLQRDGMTNDEKLWAVDPGNVNVEQYDQQRKLLQEYEEDLKSPKVKQLKENCISSFDEWSEKVISRVGEVVNSRKTAKQQLHRTISGEVGSTAEPEGETDVNPGPPTSTVVKVGKIVGTPESTSTLKFRDLYPPIKNPLTKLTMDQRTLILHSVLLLMLSLENYNARSRVLLLLLCSSLKLPLKTLEQDEYTVAKGLLEGVKELSAQEETKKKVESTKDARKWKVGIATAAGAALIGVTGGLAAPLVAAGVGSLMGGLGLGATSAAAYLGSVAGSTYIVGGLFGAYGGRMTGKMMDNYAQEVEDFQFLPLHSDKKTSEDKEKGAKQASDHDHKLRVSIVISGWLTEQEEVVKPWRVLGPGAESFALKYALEAMLNLGNAMDGLVKSAAWTYAKKQIIAQTILADLAAALWPIGLVKAARVIDNPFNVAKNRSEKAGEVLADALINKAQGERPVSLIGYSLGARVIYSCLMSLARRNAFGLIDNAILIGAPTPSDTSDWRMLRSVVSGRLVNVYSTNDYVLGFMYRTSSLQYGVAGLQPVQGLSHVENVDASEEVTGHLRYRFLIGSILRKIGFEDLDMEAVEEEKVALQKMEEEEQKQSLVAERKRQLRREQTGGKEDEAAEAEEEAVNMEKEVQEKTQKSLVTKAIEYISVPSILSNSPDVDKKSSPVTSTSHEKSQQVSNTTADDDASTQSFAQRAYQALPSMPHINRSTKSSEVDSQNQAHNPTQSTKSQQGGDETYRSKAAGYLPSMPKKIPSIPAVPGFGAGKGVAQDQSAPQTGQQALQATKQSAYKVTETADELVRPTVKNVANLQNNPALKASK